MKGSGHLYASQAAVVVKQEPEASAGSRGVSEAGAREGLYTDRELKSEAAFEPVVFLDDLKEIFVKEEAKRVKQEDECEWSAAQATLYAGHKVNGELVLGPEGPQLRDVAFKLYAGAQVPEGRLGQKPGSSLGCGRGQLALRDCVVRLERDLALETLLELSARQEISEKSKEMSIQTENEMDASSTGSNSIIRIDEEKYTCPICHTIFALKSSLMEHVVVHIHMPASPEQERRGSGSALGRARSRDFTPSPAPPQRHTPATHASKRKRPHRCAICSKQFTHLSRLKLHRLFHTGEKPYSCDVCARQFHTSSDFNEHRLIHMSAIRYSCEICGKQFLTSSDFNEHRHTHMTIRNYTCKICRKQLPTSSDFNIHKQIHTNKPYCCEICAKQFSTSSQLNKHRLIHMSSRIYSCEICGKHFSTSSDFNEHRQIHMRSDIWRRHYNDRQQTGRDAPIGKRV